MKEIEFVSIAIKDIIFPLVAIIAAAVATWIAVKRARSFRVSIKPPPTETESSVLQQIRDALSEEDPQIRAKALELIEKRPLEVRGGALTYDTAKFDEYHSQSLGQAQISFWFSLVFAAIGFLVIGASVFLYKEKTSYPGIVAGTIVEAVAGLFFQQSNRARKLMSEFFEKLRADRRLDESLKLCDAIDNKFMRNALKVKLSLDFSGLEDSHNIAKDIILIAKGGPRAGRLASPSVETSGDEDS